MYNWTVIGPTVARWSHIITRAIFHLETQLGNISYNLQTSKLGWKHHIPYVILSIEKAH